MIKVEELPSPSASELAKLPRELRFVPSDNPSPQCLTKQQIAEYNDQGYLMPFDGLDERQAVELRAYFDGVLDAFLEQGHNSYAISTAHLRFGRIYDLVRHPAFVGPVRDLLGENIVAWGSHFFCKMPGDGRRVAWHQDAVYWPLSPSKTVTLWLAIDDADPENANMRFVPRSHQHGAIEYRQSDDQREVLGLVVDDASEYGDPAVDVTLRAGQFSLHADLLLHGSEANSSNRRRCGLTIRYAAADVQAWYEWGKKGVVVCGTDADRHWANLPRPGA